jgi:hypothetical protein
LGGKISPNFDLKNMILIYAKDFSMEENGPNLQDFEKKKKVSKSRFFMISSSR